MKKVIFLVLFIIALFILYKIPKKYKNKTKKLLDKNFHNIVIFMMALIISYMIFLHIGIDKIRDKLRRKPKPKPLRDLNISYPDIKGHFSVKNDPMKIPNFIENIGSLLQSDSVDLISFDKCVNDNNKSRSIFVDYLSRTFNGTDIEKFWELTLDELITIMKSFEFFYEVHDWPGNDVSIKGFKKWLQDKTRYTDCVASNNDNCRCKCDLDTTKSKGHRYKCKNKNCVLAINNTWPKVLTHDTPIETETTNWTSDNNHSFLFQTIMSHGTQPYGLGPNLSWWGSKTFTDPYRSSLRRGMMNSPQNNPKFYNIAFGSGGIPPNVMAEILIMPIDSAFAPAGTISSITQIPNSCSPDFENLCKLDQNDLPPRQIYSYFTPGTGVFYDVGSTAYMYNFVDGFLNIPEECYSDTLSQPNFPPDIVKPTLYNELISKRRPDGMPDHVVGISKMLVYMARKAVIAPKSYSKTSRLVKLNDTTVVPQYDNKGNVNLDYLPDYLVESLKDGGFPDNPRPEYYPIHMNLRLPRQLDSYLDNNWPGWRTDLGMRTLLNGGLGLEGYVDLSDAGSPPRGLTSPRSLLSQVAALMGVWIQTNPEALDKNSVPKQHFQYGLVKSGLKKFSMGLLTPNGAVEKADCPFIDKRKYAMGWINGRWYGYPPMKSYNSQDDGHVYVDKDLYPNFGRCDYVQKKRSDPEHSCCQVIGARGVSEDTANSWKGGGIFSKGGKFGVPGKKELESEQWDGDWFMPTKSNPLIYYDIHGDEVYRTWYGKPIQMDYINACKLIGAMYSMGDTGWDLSPVCWPFGSFFAYAEDLGLGQQMIGENLGKVFGTDTLHFTQTPTSLSKSQLVSPAYDYEIILLMKDPKIQSAPCFCKNYIYSVDLSHNNGKSLQKYLHPSRGAIGGWFPQDAKIKYNGIRGLSNYTYVSTIDGWNAQKSEKHPPLCKYLKPPKPAKTDADAIKYAEEALKANIMVSPGKNREEIKKSIDPRTGKYCVKSPINVENLFYAGFSPTEKNQITGLSNELRTDLKPKKC